MSSEGRYGNQILGALPNNFWYCPLALNEPRGTFSVTTIPLSFTEPTPLPLSSGFGKQERIYTLWTSRDQVAEYNNF